jgi:hypothetical protein
MSIKEVQEYADLVRDQPEDTWGRRFLYRPSNGRMCKMGYALFKVKGKPQEEFFPSYKEAMDLLGLTADEADALIYLNDAASSMQEAQAYIDRLAAGEDRNALLTEARQKKWAHDV